MDVLMDYVWESDESELNRFRDLGYEIMYQDVNLSAIYEELEICFEHHEMDQKIKEHFGFYGLSALLHVNNVYYWIMQI